MPLLNYTTSVPAKRSVSEITGMLQDGGATAVLFEYDAQKRVKAISFKLETTFGEVPYSLPANVPGVQLALNSEIKAEDKRVWAGRNYRRRIPKSLFNNYEQAERIAWRIVRDWLEVQLAIHQLGAARLEQVMLPFAVNETTGKTFYETFLDRGTLALPAAHAS